MMVTEPLAKHGETKKLDLPRKLVGQKVILVLLQVEDQELLNKLLHNNTQDQQLASRLKIQDSTLDSAVVVLNKSPLELLKLEYQP